MRIMKTSATLNLLDKWGALKVRWGIGRHDYIVPAGLYALGEPTPESPVLVTANYKLTFDIVRSQLQGLHVYLLLLDTKGVNVWCAAGKGTFGTEELVLRINTVCLSDVVSHRKIVLPQLSAPGIAAHDVKQQTGFNVIFGPVRAEDLPTFLSDEMKATQTMRQVKFTLVDRTKLIPVELVNYFLPMLLIICLLSLLTWVRDMTIHSAMIQSIGIPVILGYIGGVGITPLLLPWIPTRAFSMKGFLVGFTLALLFQLIFTPWVFIIPAISSYLAMNFTGSSTYTSLTGVKKEMKVAIPLQITSFIIGMVGLML